MDHCQAHHGPADQLHLETVPESKQETKEIKKSNLILRKSEFTGIRCQQQGRVSSDVNSNDPKALSLFLSSKVSVFVP